MKELEDKYLKGDITEREVEMLDRLVRQETDDAIADRMEKRWLQEDDDTAAADRRQLEDVWQRVRLRTGIPSSQTARNASRRWWLVAAAALLPFFMLCTAYLYWQQSLSANADVVIETGAGERAGITLPDGSRLVLNQNTAVRYNPRLFNRKQRIVDFEGEAYFDIARDRRHPFDIRTDKSSVRVLGTKFNLMSRSGERHAVLSLEEGNVLMTSTENNRQVSLHNMQRATLDKASATFRVEDIEGDFRDVVAWRRHEMIFHDTPLQEVLKSVEQAYGVSIRATGGIDADDLYSGTMPLSDIHVCLQIIEGLYHLKATMRGKEIILHRKLPVKK